MRSVLTSISASTKGLGIDFLWPRLPLPKAASALRQYSGHSAAFVGYDLQRRGVGCRYDDAPLGSDPRSPTIRATDDFGNALPQERLNVQSFVEIPLLRVGYEIAGPANGFPLILAHGWPDDVRTWDRVLAALHGAGYRTHAPWLRGYGPTRFLREDTFRSGQLVALRQDLVDFAAALGLTRYAVIGHDWGARAAYIASVLGESRVAACVALSHAARRARSRELAGYERRQGSVFHRPVRSAARRRRRTFSTAGAARRCGGTRHRLAAAILLRGRANMATASRRPDGYKEAWEAPVTPLRAVCDEPPAP